MRIIAGDYKGRRLHTPVDERIRPTTDKVKEAVFSMLDSHIGLFGIRALDLFSGTGNLGLEALSRGARHCWFGDSSRDSLKLIKENIAYCRAQDKSTVLAGDFRKTLGRLETRMDVIFLDPPYGTALLEQSLEAIVRFDILSEHGIIICESAADRLLPTLSSPYEMGREYRYGKIKLTVFHRTGSEQRE